MIAFTFAIVAVPALTSFDGRYKAEDVASYDQPEQEAIHTVTVTSDNRLAEYTFWLSIFTAVLATGTLALWYVTWAALRHAREDSERQARETAQSLQIAEKGAKASEASAERALRTDRPFIFSDDITADEPGLRRIKDGYGIKLLCHFRNVGTRPAIVRLLAITYSTDALAETLPATIGDVDFDWGIVLPGDPIQRAVPMQTEDISQAEAERVNAGAKRFFVFGYIRYGDVHGISRRSGFAYQFIVPHSTAAKATFMKCGPSQYWYDVEES